ncbi:hypothetical protein ACJX0J_020037, partial [Zea mays]
AKIPYEVIAWEIVINNADPSVRYKLTKRQTQEERSSTSGGATTRCTTSLM